MVVKYLAIGCMGTERDKGLYLFDVQKENTFKAVPDAKFEEVETRKLEYGSPKDLLCLGSFLYTLTKSALFKREVKEEGTTRRVDTAQSSDASFCFPISSRVSDLTSGIEDDKKAFSAILEEPGKVTGHLTAHKNSKTNSLDVLMSIYREESLKEEVTPGFLLRFPDGDLQKAEIVEREITGPAVIYGGEVYYAHKHELWGPKTISFRNPYSQILSATVTRTTVRGNLEEILALTSNTGEYIIKSKEGEIRNPEFEQESLFSTEQHHLPSEATAVAVVKYEEELYVLFGLNRGKLRIYQKDGLELKFLKTIDLLNEYDRVYNKDSSTDHIKNIIWRDGDGEIYLSFLSRAFCFPLGELIRAAKSDKEVVLQEVLHYIQLEPKVRETITCLPSSEEKVAAKVINSIVNWTKDTNNRTLEEVVKEVAGDSGMELTMLLSQVHDHRYLRRMMERIHQGKNETTEAFSTRYQAGKVQGVTPAATFEVPHRITRMIALE